MRVAYRFAVARVLSGLLMLAVLFSFQSPTAAQNVASLTGLVTDSTGAVVPDVAVKLVDTKTNTTYGTKTNSVGAYTFPTVLPGPSYAVTFSKQGFTSLTVSDIYIAVGATHTQNAHLQLGKLAETVEVTAQGANVTLNTTDTTVGNNFDMQLVHELPVAVRDNPTGLLVYEPGVVTAAGADDPGGNRNGAVTGSRADQGSYTLDGLDINDYSIGQSFITVGQAPVDSIQEFRGETANPLSSEGRGSGVQVSLVTKSGTNKFHGSAYEYHRNTVTEANDWFNNLNGIRRPVLIRNQFGGSLGGPIVKNKLFFFFNYEGRRDASQAAVEWTVPLDSYRNGLVSYINSSAGCSASSRQNTQPNCITQLNAAQVQTINPSANLTLNAALLNYINGRYPRANDLTNPVHGDGINTGGYRTNLPAHDSPNIYVSRIDYNLNDKMKLFGRFTIHREIQGDNFNFPAPSEFPGDPLTRVAQNHNYAYVVAHTWTISNTMVNQFAYGITRQRFATPSLYNPLGNTDYVNGAGGSNFGIVSAPYESQSGQDRHVSVPVYRDDFTYVRGTHTFQAGGIFKPISQLSSLGNSLYTPVLGIGGALTALDSSLRPNDILADSANHAINSWDATLPFALGRYASISTSYNYSHSLQSLPVGTPSVRHYAAKETEVYVQDAWKTRSDLTITYGLRYTYYSVPYETAGLEAISNVGFSPYINSRVQSGLQGTGACGVFLTACPATGVAPGDPLIMFNLAGKANHAPGYYHSDWRDFAPRVGLAYNPSLTGGMLGKVLGDRKTVIRAGAGIVYDHPTLNSVQFLQNQLAAIFTTTASQPYPLQSGLTPAQALSAGPFFNKLGEVPPGLAGPSNVTVPFSPFTNFVGQGVVGNQLNFSFDPNFKTPYSETVTFGIQRELPHQFQLDATFFGRFGRRLMAESDAGELVDFKDPTSGQLMSQAFVGLEQDVRAGSNIREQQFFDNLVPAIPGLGNTGTQVVVNALGPFVQRGDMGTVVFVLEQNGLLPFGIGFNPQYPYNIYSANKSASNYDGLLVTLHKKYSQGVQFDLNYTYSHSIDNLSAIANNVFGQGANFSGGVLCDPINLRVCRGNSDFDITHIITGDGIYDLPFGKGKYFGGRVSGRMNQLIGGWQIAGNTQWRTGLAFTTLSNAFPFSFNNDVPAIFNGSNSALKVHVHETQGQVQLFADPTKAINAFGEPLGFQAGSRNNLRGPHLSITDLSLNKHFLIRENYTLEFRAEAYNVFNHPSFGLPGGGFGGTADISNPSTFGFIATTASGARVMQFALRVDF
jgi:Carboxypeptidase regulatory-like domain